MRLAVLALSRLHVRIGREPGSSADTAVLDRARELAARMLHSISEALEAGVKGDPHPECLRELREIAERLRAPHDVTIRPQLAAMRADARWQLDALTGQLAAAVELAAHTSPTRRQEFERREAAQPWSLRLAGVLAVLRANLTLDSAAFRHALRLAACVVIADTVGRSIGWQRAYWAPMTVAIVLKPDFTTTFSRGVLRLAGTFTGLALATALFHSLAPSAMVQALLIGIFMFLMRWAGPANYGVLVTALTSLVVLLFAITGVAPAEVIAARALFTVVGRDDRAGRLPCLAHLGTHAGARGSGSPAGRVPRLFPGGAGRLPASRHGAAIRHSRRAWSGFARRAGWRAPRWKLRWRACGWSPA